MKEKFKLESLFHNLMKTCCFGGLMALLMIGLPGCGDGRPNMAPVSGQVLIDGKPLTYGSIRFVPTGARASIGKLDEEGRFTLTCFSEGDGAVLGKHQVTITAREPISEEQSRWHAPRKYADLEASGLEQEITGATDSLVIEISWDGGKPFVD